MYWNSRTGPTRKASRETRTQGPRHLFFLICLLVAIPLFVHEAVALECRGRFVAEGDRKFEVRSICGKPAVVQRWKEETIVFERIEEDLLDPLRTSNLLDVEEWTYNFGTRRFLYFLRFENGRLTRIESGAYGFDGPALEAPVDAADCRRFLEPGERMIEVLRHCGKPRERDSREEIRTLSVGDADSGILRRQKVRVIKEEWAYDFGSSRFIFFVMFENGRVTAVEDRGYGR